MRFCVQLALECIKLIELFMVGDGGGGGQTVVRAFIMTAGHWHVSIRLTTATERCHGLANRTRPVKHRPCIQQRMVAFCNYPESLLSGWLSGWLASLWTKQMEWKMNMMEGNGV